MTRQHSLAGIVVAAALATAGAPVNAQVQRSGGGGESQKIMLQYQQVAAEKTALQAQLAQMKKDLDAANAELATVKKERDVAKARVGAAIPPAAIAKATGAREAAERNLEQSKQRMTELVARFRETATNLKDVEADRTKIRKELTDRDAAFDKCAQDNVQLLDINSEILDRYQHVGLFTKVSATEPFTKITRTRIDNLSVEYRERAEQLRVRKATP